MEEAKFLCDRLGIFVDRGLECIGSSRELKRRYSGSYVFMITTSTENKEEVERMVRDVSANAKKVYHLAGTMKYEVPEDEVKIAYVFMIVKKAKRNFTVFAWGLTDTTLEYVFFKVATTVESFVPLSQLSYKSTFI